MKQVINSLLMIAALLTVSVLLQAQTLDVTVTNIGGNRIQFMGTATGSGFSTPPANAWASMNLTWRIPKSIVHSTALSQVAPSATPEVTGEASAFTGGTPRDGFTHGLDLAVFDVTTFGGPDDGYWYFQVTGTTQAVQNIATGGTVLLYDFSLPWDWKCPSCVELLTTDVPDMMTYGGISTTSFIDNGGLGIDVLNIVTNLAPLPVTWLNVEAEPKDDQLIQVRWGTASEQNNAGFEVERSDDGGLNFHVIASVAGHNNTNTPSYYTVNDEQVTRGIRYYYRIKQTDRDGRVSYSKMVAAMLLNGSQFTVQVKPNPVHGVLNLEIQSAKEQAAQVVITDITGRLYKSDRIARLSRAATRHTYSVNYPSGVYIVKVIAEDGTTQAVKFMIGQ